MKKIHKLVIRAWVGPFMVAFTVILFILVLQFMAKYIDEIFGKGIEAIVLAKVFWYACLTLVTMAVPLAILLSTLLTMGNLGERYELAAIKSGGISLFRVINPLTYGVIVVTVASLFFSFYLMPIANLKLYTLLYDLSKVKPTFALKEDHFYDGVDGMVIHVDDIDRAEVDLLHNVKIFDHADKVGNNRITLAKRGTMVPGGGGSSLDLTLYDGVIHEMVGKDPQDKRKNQYQRFYFDTLRYKVALSGFDLEESDQNTFRNHQYMLSIDELHAAVDSMTERNASYYQDFVDYSRKYVHVDTIPNSGMQKAAPPDSTVFGKDGRIMADKAKPVAEWFPDLERVELMNKTIHQARAIKNYANVIHERIAREGVKTRKYAIEIHNRWMLPASCLVFLFLGAPLGAIIRKGGIGLPVIFSILFFIIFYILMIQGKKFARDDLMPVWAGVWLPMLVMSPMALAFTYQSATDSAILYMAGWHKLYRFLFGWIRFRKRKDGPDRSTLSIEDLIALRKREKEKARDALEKAREQARVKREKKAKKKG